MTTLIMESSIIRASITGGLFDVVRACLPSPRTALRSRTFSGDDGGVGGRPDKKAPEKDRALGSAGVEGCDTGRT